MPMLRMASPRSAGSAERLAWPSSWRASAELIWLDRAALRARCGIWSHVNTTKTPGGEREQIVYNRYFYVYLHNGVVTSVKKRRQIFTGFKLRP